MTVFQLISLIPVLFYIVIAVLIIVIFRFIKHTTQRNLDIKQQQNELLKDLINYLKQSK